MKGYTPNRLINTSTRKGYTIFSEVKGRPWNLNLIAVRSDDDTPETFDDELYVLWEDNAIWNCLNMRFTTDPGVYWLKHPMNKLGTAILIPGQYRGVFQKGFHKGKPALRQVKPMKYWRDNNKDSILDQTEFVDESIAHTNLHRAGIDSQLIGKWGAGCQVVARDSDMDLLMHLVGNALPFWGDKFSYTLLEEKDFNSYY